MSKEKLLINDVKSNNPEVMSNKQIEEMALTEVDILANDLNQYCADLAETYCGEINCLTCLAHALIDKGYRKQNVGEWIKDEESRFEHRYHCSVCNFYLIGEPTKYCEDCGAKMKGAENEQRENGRNGT